MKIVIAMDSFKGTLSAQEACSIVATAIKECLPDAQVVIKPMADGGEGTARALIEAAGGRWICRKVMGPLPDMIVDAGFAWFEKERIALIETASASGIELLSKSQLDPLKTTTYGTGRLIKASMKYKPKKILLALGGSATVDGGVGAAAALGWEFFDAAGKKVSLGGAPVKSIEKIVKPRQLSLPKVEVLCDVDNPLCGKRGAARVYGPQKGATPEMIEELESSLSHLAKIIRKQLKVDISIVPGAGSAGGFGAGAMAFMKGRLVSGIDVVMSMSKLADAMRSADWVLTGEGSFDLQSLRGKVVCGITRMAKKSRVPVAVLAGQVKVARRLYQKCGVFTAIACRKPNNSFEYAMKNSRKLLFIAAEEFAEKNLLCHPAQ